MPHIVEYQVPLPMQLDEYKVAQLYAVAKASERETTGEDGVEIVKNEPYEGENGEKGQYTYKIYHLGNRLPGWLSSLLPKNLKEVHEEAWNAYPVCKTVITSPFLGNRFELRIESRHSSFVAADGYQKNAHNLDEKTLKKRTVEILDIAFDPVDEKKCKEDPKKFKSEKTGRGLLEKGWQKTVNPCMVAYKLASVKVDYPMVGGKVEKWIQGFEKDLFTTFHRQLFCWIDEWFGLSLEDIRKMEEETKERNRQKLAALNASKGKDAGGKGDKHSKEKALDLEHDADAIAAAKKVVEEQGPDLPDPEASS